MKNNKMNIVMFLSILLVLLIIFFPKNSKQEQAFLEKYGLINMSIQERVSYLEDVTDEDEEFFAGITGKELTLADDNENYSYKLPNNQFYLSIAPYINNTHPCSNHNLITCRGELKNQTMDITVKDSSGNVIINDTYTSKSNGFLGLWLPKNMSGTITINYQGLTTTEKISTFESDNTCLTTLKLN